MSIERVEYYSSPIRVCSLCTYFSSILNVKWGEFRVQTNTNWGLTLTAQFIYTIVLLLSCSFARQYYINPTNTVHIDLSPNLVHTKFVQVYLLPFVWSVKFKYTDKNVRENISIYRKSEPVLLFYKATILLN